jgi:hypothetical protein
MTHVSRLSTGTSKTRGLVEIMATNGGIPRAKSPSDGLLAPLADIVNMQPIVFWMPEELLSSKFGP